MNIKLSSSSFLGSFRTYYPDVTVLDDYLTGIRETDLVIFPGGCDVNPSLYGQPLKGAYGFSEERDSKESKIYWACVARGIPMLGVCRGHQLLFALEGGSLIQDIRPMHHAHHELLWLKEHPISNFYPDGVNSMHHQGYTVDELESNDIIPLAIEPASGIVEAAENVISKFITVQFHPEMMSLAQSGKFFEYILSWAKEVR